MRWSREADKIMCVNAADPGLPSQRKPKDKVRVIWGFAQFLALTNWCEEEGSQQTEWAHSNTILSEAPCWETEPRGTKGYTHTRDLCGRCWTLRKTFKERRQDPYSCRYFFCTDNVQYFDQLHLIYVYISSKHKINRGWGLRHQSLHSTALGAIIYFK